MVVVVDVDALCCHFDFVQYIQIQRYILNAPFHEEIEPEGCAYVT